MAAEYTRLRGRCQVQLRPALTPRPQAMKCRLPGRSALAPLADRTSDLLLLLPPEPSPTQAQMLLRSAQPTRSRATEHSQTQSPLVPAFCSAGA